VHLRHRPVTLRDIVDMRVGDVIPLDVPEVLQAEVDGVPVFECRHGTKNGRYALKVERFLGRGRPKPHRFREARMADENQITDDDWAAAMQEQAAARTTGDSEADRVAAELAAAAMGDSPYQARPASQLFEDFGGTGGKPGASTTST
jgi:hypothetical protein